MNQLWHPSCTPIMLHHMGVRSKSGQGHCDASGQS
jgi:hypothetical protein